ncbi:hypothetical protein PLESTB_000841100 [Pleodorina starrii]|uniref:Mitochondrial processing peptidase alpha subunit n=1 Tax=Pleodorina starrii TaxID=330485 RepID=A0A9W6BLS9_9CHLO|nr:hypothetical protein PLESTM_000156900 [Pleodorina starrii]GLC54263.1 hypothetical protein PLESTB_000841100 [Pleodorina starrii]GLC64436.1 hypothetical protein PLESTF_000165800 [Pleodorina starrii]
MGLRRAALRLLRDGTRSESVRCLSTTGALAAGEAGAGTSSANGSVAAHDFLDWMKDGGRRITTPLSQPLPGVQPERPSLPPLSPPPTQITVLDNGVRIISEASPGPTASLGMYINSGSIYETAQNSGCSALLECLGFKATSHRPTLRIMKEVEKFGNTIVANASREQMSYTIDCLKTGFPAALELLLDCVLNPAFEEAEVEDQKARLAMLLGGKDIHATLMTELLTRAAYRGPYGNPLIPDPDSMARLSPEALRSFVAAHFIAPHLVLAASGVEHEQLVGLAGPMLQGLPKAAPLPEPKPQYVGGFVHLPGPYPQSNLLLAFEYGGGWRDVHGAVVMTVLNYLLGGGNSFSSGGPGKGMHSRLYTRVLNKYGFVHSCASFNSTFNESGLVGIQAASEPNRVGEMLNIMCSELEAVENGANRVELERAKRAAVSVICNALESKATSAEDIGRQYLTYGHRISGRTYVEMLEAVTQDDIRRFVQRLLSSKPSLAAYGDRTETLDPSILTRRYG